MLAFAFISCNSSSELAPLPVDRGPVATSYDIKVKIDDYDQGILTLAYFYGSKQYVTDTAQIATDGYYHFTGDEPLKEGVYMMVMAPNNSYLQCLVTNHEQTFTLETTKDSLVQHMQVTNSVSNTGYFEYLNYLNKQIPKKRALSEQFDKVKEDTVATAKIREEMAALDKVVKTHQGDLAKQYGDDLFGRMMAADQVTETPEFKGEDKDLQEFYFKRAHFFDHISLADEGLMRSPLLAQKVKTYMKSYIVQHPDSISAAIDDILTQTGDTDNFQYFLVDQLNEYAGSKIVGMDAVYVHLVKNYYEKGLAYWTDPEALEKIIDNGNTLEPLLIGKPAPDLLFKTEAGQNMRISNSKSDYTVLLFWDPECSHCEKAMPDMIEFNEEYKNNGVEVLAICTAIGAESEVMEGCAAKIKEFKMDNWTNLSDQYHQSKFKTVYDIQSTPQIYILDKDKKIIMKKIGADQISDVMKQIMEDAENKES